MSESDDESSPVLREISWPLERETARHNGNGVASLPFSPPAAASPPFDPSFTSGGTKALSGISRRAFGLGITFGVMIITTAELAFLDMVIWRATFFVAVLALFHYLEFYATARYNPSDAKLSSFLLSSNGSAYNVAHTLALVEFSVRTWLQSSGRWARMELPLAVPAFLPGIPSNFSLVLGLILVAVGQAVRTAAMAEAGKSFNHIVQSRKKDDHVLVKTGVYRIMRHPSYFGFFWWGLGTQIFLGNPICFLAYAIILWNFFASRIAKEEQFLVKFFGQDYVRYRERTSVLIPFIS